MQDIITAVREDMIEAQLASDQYVAVMITPASAVYPQRRQM